MTGRLPVRDGMTVALIPGAGRRHVGKRDYPSPRFCPTPATRPRCSASGTWGDSDTNLPQMKGFDEFWGFLYHVDAYLYKERIGFDEKAATALPGLVQAKRGQPLEVVKRSSHPRALPYIDEEAAAKAVRYVAGSLGSDRPFLPLCSVLSSSLPPTSLIPTGRADRASATTATPRWSSITTVALSWTRCVMRASPRTPS